MIESPTRAARSRQHACAGALPAPDKKDAVARNAGTTQGPTIGITTGPSAGPEILAPAGPWREN